MDNQTPVALITGGGSGIGRACALRLSSEGYNIALAGRTRRTLEEAAEHCAGDSVILPADVSDPAAARQLVEDTVNAFGRLDAVIHCAGAAPVRSVEQTTDSLWAEVIATNLSAAFYLARAAWGVFRNQGGGVIVNISSMAARDPLPNFAAYAAAKGGVNLLGLSLAREGKPLGIRVHTIAPGATETAMFRTIATTEQYPPEKTLSPDEVAAVVFQCVNGELMHAAGEVIYLNKVI